MLKGKTILLGVTGSIAAYKIASLASMLKKAHATVHVIMTKNACNFIHPITFETLTGNKCIVDTFDRDFQFEVEHISLAKKADLCLVAPASANVIGKLAGGIADDMLTTTLLAVRCPVLLSPAMNTNMFLNPIVQDNLKKLESLGYQVIQPATGLLACNDVGLGKMPEAWELFEYIIASVAYDKCLLGKKVLVTAGPTQEAIDPVRYITNHSTGKMGYAIAKVAYGMGAEVSLISGPTNLKPPVGVKLIPVVSAGDMYEAVMAEGKQADLIIKSAAVADYTPSSVSDQKMKKSEENLFIPLTRTRDILGSLGSAKKEGQVLVGFSMETENLIENSKKKLEKKNLDLIVCNNLKVEGAGFGHDTNVVTLISKDEIEELPLLSKSQVAESLLNKIVHKYFN